MTPIHPILAKSDSNGSIGIYCFMATWVKTAHQRVNHLQIVHVMHYFNQWLIPVWAKHTVGILRFTNMLSRYKSKSNYILKLTQFIPVIGITHTLECHTILENYSNLHGVTVYKEIMNLVIFSRIDLKMFSPSLTKNLAPLLLLIAVSFFVEQTDCSPLSPYQVYKPLIQT